MNPVSADHQETSGGTHVPVIPLSVLFGTFAILIGMTIVTVLASKLSLGAAEIWVAMGIATVKAVLVAINFMHIRHDKPFNVLIVLFSLVFAAIFIGLTLVDSQSYQAEIGAFQDQNPN